MLTTAQTAAALQVSRRRVLELIKLGTLHAEKFGRDWQVDVASVEEYKKSERRPGRPKSKSDFNQVNVATNVAKSEDAASGSGKQP